MSTDAPDPTPTESDPASDLRARESYHVAAADWVAGASEIGQRHHTNQDFLALGVPTTAARLAVLAVSDGVSTSVNAEQASMRAATTIRDELMKLLVNPEVSADTAPQVLSDAYRRANGAVLADGQDGTAVGSCTLIVAMVMDDVVHLGNIGDTRAYWLADDGTQQQLSVDDSIAQAQIEMGMSREQAERGVHAHAITKWLGPTASDVTPRVTSFTVDRPGWLVVCSDGLWNYASTPEELGSIARQIWASMPAGDGPEVLAHTLAQWANAQGGRDNITVALARLGDTQTFVVG